LQALVKTFITVMGESVGRTAMGDKAKYKLYI